MIVSISAKDEPESLLHVASRNNRSDDVIRLLSTDHNMLNSLGNGKQTPIMAATLAGHANIVKLLL